MSGFIASIVGMASGKGDSKPEISDAKPAAAPPAPAPTLPTKTVLVIDAGKTDWKAIFKGATVRLPVRRRPPARRAGADSATGAGAGAGAGAGHSSPTDGASAVGGGADKGKERQGGATKAATAGEGGEAAGEAKGDDGAGGTKEFGIEVVQAGWDTINLCSYSDSGCVVSVATKRIFNGAEVHGSRCVKPSFVLIRNVCKGVGPGQDYRNLIYGLRFGLVPSINSLHAVMSMFERPVVHAELLAIQRRLGRDVFPVVNQTYYPNSREMIIGPDFPAVVKVGHAHAGYGKMIIQDHHAFEDFGSVMAILPHYCTAEAFITGDYDVRVQKIGDTYRAFKRQSVSGTWKTNTGTSVTEMLEVTPQYKLWADECSKCFGGLDIVTVDAIHSVDDDKEYILEMNGTASGLHPDVEDEDNAVMRDLVLRKMEACVTA